MMNGLDVLLIVAALSIFWKIMKSMDRHEAWINRLPARLEARKEYERAYAADDDELDDQVYEIYLKHGIVATMLRINEEEA